MFELNTRSYRILTATVVYLIAVAAALTIATINSRTNLAAAGSARQAPFEFGGNQSTGKPFFSLSTYRTFGANENPRFWVDYHDVDHLEFRVYQIQDPAKFLAQLRDPHQMGEREREALSTTIRRSPSVLERIRAIKTTAYSEIKTYVRSQIQHHARKSFNSKFRQPDNPARTPLNVSDYARVPLLNPSQLVSSWREPLMPLENQYDRRQIPLGKRPAGMYLVEAVAGDLRAYTIAVVTDLTIIDKTTRHGELLVYAVDRRTGQPRSNAQIQVVRNRKTVVSGVTDSHGILRTGIDKKQLEAEQADPEDLEVNNTEAFLIMAHQKNDFAISDLQSFYFLGYQGENNEENVKGYIYTDRPVYRPKQKIFFKGVLRSIDESGTYKRIADQRVHVVIEDPNNSRVFEQDLTISARGTFHGEFETTEEAPLGSYQVLADTEGGITRGSFEVAEYKKPEYKVKVTSPQEFVPAGDKVRLSIDARYFFGAPVANAEVQYYIYRSPHYAWYRSQSDAADFEQDEDEYPGYSRYGGDMVHEGNGKLNANGHFDLEFQVPAADENDSVDYSYQIEAQVIDSARRTINGSTSFVATRGSTVTSADPDRYVYHKGDTAKISIKTTDYEGRPVAARVDLKFIEQTWIKKPNPDNDSYPQYERQQRELASAAVNTDVQGNASYDYLASEAGNFLIQTVVNEGGKNVVSVGGYLWVTDRDYAWTDSSYYSENHGAIKLVPDKKSYRAGETAHVLAILPTDNAHLLVSTELSNIKSAWQVSVTGRSTVLDVPINANYAPNFFLSVSYVKDGEMYTTNKRLVVPPREKMLNLEIISNKKEYKPRETASYTVLARNANGAPVSGAEISLGVVDEAIYSISPDYSGSILREFYGMSYNAVDTHFSISYVFTGYAGDKPLELARNKPSYQLADFKNEGDPVEPMVRKEFKDTAFWQPNVITGADGRATVKVKLPDNLTTWRATAKAVTEDTMVGSTTYKVIARKDVILRLETPRFITQGDIVTLSATVHNYLKSDKSTHISLAVEGAQLLGAPKTTVTIAKEGEHRIDWQISAPNTGQVRLLAKALTNTESDAVELPLEVVPRGLREVKNETWVTTEDSAEKTFIVNIPENADSLARRLRIEVSPSIAGSLFGALDYLTTYPYGCTEQTMSSFLPNVIVTQALRDVKSTSIRKKNDLPAKVQKGMNRLYSFQHEDGGWGWWKDDQTNPFMTAYVIDGLTQAKQAGYAVDEERLTRGRAKLRQMLVEGKTDTGTTIDLETRSFMVYSLFESGGEGAEFLERLYLERSGLQPYGRALLALTLKLNKNDARAREVANEIEQSASADANSAYWQSRRQAMLDFAETNDVEASALSLKALAQIKPESSLLPKAARALVARRPNSYFWNSTKDTAFAISGLIDYLKTSRELSPNYDLEVYVNGETVAAQRVTSATALQSVVITRRARDVSSTNHIRIVKRGRGSLYFSTSLDYHTDEDNVPARGSSTLNLTREYFRLRVVEDGYKLKWALEPLAGDIHSGDLLVVKLRLTGAKARHLMIEDPIPAGAEQINQVGNLNLSYTADGNWSDWYSSREFRDQRTVFFLDYFDGDATLQYCLRVQVPGEFRIAPARSELMYRPEIQANTTSGKINFLDR